MWGRDVSEHDARLNQVRSQAQEVNLMLNLDKCHIRKAEVSYIGHCLTKEGLKPDPKKIQAIQEMQRPQNLKELRTFLGFMQYLAKFMPNMANVSAPL